MNSSAPRQPSNGLPNCTHSWNDWFWKTRTGCRNFGPDCADDGLPEGITTPLTSSVIVELDDSLAADEAIDLQNLSLNFLEPPAHPELLGRLGRYDIERVIGSGGMGIVLKALDTELHRIVAVKVLAPHLAAHATARRRFAREAQAAAAVVHPHVIPIHNVETDGPVPWLVMQYVAGESLQQRVDRQGPLPLADVLRIAQQTAAGLSAAHAQGLVHRDVKPANILLEDQVDRVLLSDFGLARTADDASLTRTGFVAGTPFYMSPEQALGERIDHRSDLFSLGCVIYFALTGYPPFRASGAMAVLHRICHEPHQSLEDTHPEVPLELCRLVDRLLEKSVGNRPQSAADVDQELTGLLALLQQNGLALRRRRRAWNPLRHLFSFRQRPNARHVTRTIIILLVVALAGVSGALIREWMRAPLTPPTNAPDTADANGQPPAADDGPRDPVGTATLQNSPARQQAAEEYQEWQRQDADFWQQMASVREALDQQARALQSSRLPPAQDAFHRDVATLWWQLNRFPATGEPAADPR